MRLAHAALRLELMQHFADGEVVAGGVCDAVWADMLGAQRAGVSVIQFIKRGQHFGGEVTVCVHCFVSSGSGPRPDGG